MFEELLALLRNRDLINLVHIIFVTTLLYLLATRDEREPTELTKFLTGKNFLMALAIIVFLYHLYLYLVRRSLKNRLDDLLGPSVVNDPDQVSV